MLHKIALAAAAAAAIATAAPVAAQQATTQDPFIATQFDASGNLLPGWLIVGGLAVFVGIAAATSGTD
jgi:hypothetical protein